MTSLRELPELGVGIVYWPELQGPLQLSRQRVDVLEVEPQAFWLSDASSESGYALDRHAFEHLRTLPHPKIVHGVGFPVGGTIPASAAEIDAFADSIRSLDGVWASEHLSFNRIADGTQIRDLGFLLPPLQSVEGVELYAANIAAMRSRLPVPFAVETGVNYLRIQPGELPDGEFFASVACAADCGLLLDVHNLWTNQRNGRQPVLDAVAQLPVDRVIELHLAGGQEFDGFWVDAHSGLVPDEVFELAWRIVPQLPNLKAIIFEVMPQYVTEFGITASDLAAQLARLHELWQVRGSSVPAGAAVHRHRPSAVTVLPAQWESAVAVALDSPTPSEPHTQTRSEPHTQTRVDLSHDPGIAVLRQLIGGVRAGKVASTLTMTIRLLLLTVGERGMRQLFDEFWAAEPNQPAASDEAANFAHFLDGHPIAGRVEVLPDVMQFELAAHRATLTGQDQQLTLAFDPHQFVAALRGGRIPPAPTGPACTVTVTPPTRKDPPWPN